MALMVRQPVNFGMTMPGIGSSMKAILNRGRQSGFTLVELLLYLAILSTILLAVSGFVVEMLAANAKNTAIAEVGQQANQVLSAIEVTGQNASAITTPAVGTSSITLTFTTPSNSPASFTQTAGVLTLSRGGGPAVALTNSRVGVSNFSASNLSAAGTSGIVRIQFTLSYINNSGRNEYNYSNQYVTSVTVRR